jgi:hypothetical protein
MSDEKLSVEEMCRRLIDVAVEDQLVVIDEYHAGTKFTSGDLVGMANLLATFLQQHCDRLPELDASEWAALNGIPADAVAHWWRGEKWDGKEWHTTPPREGSK